MTTDTDAVIDALTDACEGLTYADAGLGGTAPLVGYPFESAAQMAQMVTEALRNRMTTPATPPTFRETSDALTVIRVCGELKKLAGSFAGARVWEMDGERYIMLSVEYRDEVERVLCQWSDVLAEVLVEKVLL